MAVPYDFSEIEDRWRQRWERAGIHRLDADRLGSDRIFYNLVEFPYPSAEGLHVGHVFRYSGVDAYGRYRRMRGSTVFQPIGFDAFGIHTENYALKAGRHPAVLTGLTVANFRRQLAGGGMAWDWSHTLDTSRPEYYRWTQWILTRLFRAGLMYQEDAPVVWCPACLTVLAREQTEVVGGAVVCERCATTTVERRMRQWFLRTTAYADRLLHGLDGLDWPDRAKRLQRQWIGRSEGREIDFGDLTAFTTRPETLPGVTFLAVAEGHPAVGERRPHPLSGAPVPVVAADYVVDSYGTGVVMGVPADDYRDRRLAERLGLPIRVEQPLDAEQLRTVGRPAVRYRMHDWLISRQRYWGPPIPIVHCPGCGPVPVADEDLPVLLPEVKDFRPVGSGRSPLAEVADFVQAACPACGAPGRRETDVSDTFVDSAWYFLRYPSTDVDDGPWDPARTARMLPVDFYAGGQEHVQRHHLYARFMTMALHDLGLVDFEEPFPKIRLGGTIVKDGAKMSKSRANVVSPDPYVEHHGSDVLRCALLFSAPWDADGDFRDDAVAGVERFFTRVWRLIAGDGPGPADAFGVGDRDEATVGGAEGDDDDVDRSITAVTEAMERLRFNVALARLMELVQTVRSERGKRVLVQLLAPMAPHLAEELWHRSGGRFSVHTSPWPTPGRVSVERVTEIVVQVDGRVRGRIRLPVGTAEADVVAAACEATGTLDPDRAFHVPGRLVNLVTNRQ